MWKGTSSLHFDSDSLPCNTHMWKGTSSLHFNSDSLPWGITNRHHIINTAKRSFSIMTHSLKPVLNESWLIRWIYWWYSQSIVNLLCDGNCYYYHRFWYVHCWQLYLTKYLFGWVSSFWNNYNLYILDTQHSPIESIEGNGKQRNQYLL